MNRHDPDSNDLDILAQRADSALRPAGLEGHRARVALCLDISGSMQVHYASGQIQRFAERLLALAMRFDDDSSIDVFLCGREAHSVGSMKAGEHQGWISRTLERHRLESATRYGRAIESIREFYFLGAGPRTAQVSARTPVFVMFITDGNTSDEDVAKQQLIAASYEPIFWQFVGLGRSRRTAHGGVLGGLIDRVFSNDFSFLETMDTTGGRWVDNAGFFSVERPEAITLDELYSLLMSEYPRWVSAVRGRGMIP